MDRDCNLDMVMNQAGQILGASQRNKGCCGADIDACGCANCDVGCGGCGGGCGASCGGCGVDAGACGNCCAPSRTSGRNYPGTLGSTVYQPYIYTDRPKPRFSPLPEEIVLPEAKARTRRRPNRSLAPAETKAEIPEIILEPVTNSQPKSPTRPMPMTTYKTQSQTLSCKPPDVTRFQLPAPCVTLETPSPTITVETPNLAIQCQAPIPQVQQCQLPPPQVQQCQLPPPQVQQCQVPPPQVQQCQLPPPQVQQYKAPPPQVQQYQAPPPQVQQYQAPPLEILEIQVPPPQAQQYQAPPPQVQQYQAPPPQVQQYQAPPPQVQQYQAPPPQVQQYQAPPLEILEIQPRYQQVQQQQPQAQNIREQPQRLWNTGATLSEGKTMVIVPYEDYASKSSTYDASSGQTNRSGAGHLIGGGPGSTWDGYKCGGDPKVSSQQSGTQTQQSDDAKKFSICGNIDKSVNFADRDVTFKFELAPQGEKTEACEVPPTVC